jgi:hypothetical protein
MEEASSRTRAFGRRMVGAGARVALFFFPDILLLAAGLRFALVRLDPPPRDERFVAVRAGESSNSEAWAERARTVRVFRGIGAAS